MSKSSRNEVTAKELLSVLEDQALFDIYQRVNKPSSLINGSAEDLDDARSSAMRIARDMADLALKLNGAVRRAQAQERLEAIEP